MQDTLQVVAQDSEFWAEVLKNSIGPFIGMLGVLITVIVMSRSNNRQLKASNANVEKLRQDRLEEVKVDNENRKLERELEVSQAILPKTLDTLQAAFNHAMSINTLLYVAMEIDFTDPNIDVAQRSANSIHKELNDIRQWYNQNCIFLPNHLRKRFVGLINQSHRHVDDSLNNKLSTVGRDVWDKLHKTTKGIEEDIEQFMNQFDVVGRPRIDPAQKSDSDV